MLKFCSPHGSRRRSYLAVNPGSKASYAGIREGDLITSIGGKSTKGITNAEAHVLLKAAEGGKLTLGLNEESGGSPRRRQYKTIHQETLQETVKRSSVTSYCLKETVETSLTNKSNENSSDSNEKTINGITKNVPLVGTLASQRTTLASSPSTSSSSSTLKEDLKNISTDNAVASRRSSYTNCTLSPSSGSLFSEDGNMSDSQANTSKSKKRRQRRKNKKNNDNTPVKSTKENLYTVVSPEETNDTPLLTSKPMKSRSLDDDEMVKIQELSDVSCSEDKDRSNQAIVSEASESEKEGEKSPKSVEDDSSLKTFLIGLNMTPYPEETPQETYDRISATPLISVEEENTLRNFLHSLNLVTGPEEAAEQAYGKVTNAETLKQRKARRKAELEQYFLPISQNPRFLEAISEEASDRDSDREQVNLTRSLKQGTPELDIPPKVPPRPNRDKRRALKNPLPSIEQPAVLVDAKIVDISEAICSTARAEEATTGVEVVFLSSGTSTPDEASTSSNSYVLDEERDSSTEDISVLTEIENIENENNENETREVKNKDVGGTERATNSMKTSEQVVDGLLSQLTPPPTPETVSPKGEKLLQSSVNKTEGGFINAFSSASKEDVYKRLMYSDQTRKVGEHFSLVDQNKNAVKGEMEESQDYNSKIRIEATKNMENHNVSGNVARETTTGENRNDQVKVHRDNDIGITDEKKMLHERSNGAISKDRITEHNILMKIVQGEPQQDELNNLQDTIKVSDDTDDKTTVKEKRNNQSNDRQSNGNMLEDSIGQSKIFQADEITDEREQVYKRGETDRSEIQTKNTSLNEESISETSVNLQVAPQSNGYEISSKVVQKQASEDIVENKKVSKSTQIQTFQDSKYNTVELGQEKPTDNELKTWIVQTKAHQENHNGAITEKQSNVSSIPDEEKILDRQNCINSREETKTVQSSSVAKKNTFEITPVQTTIPHKKHNNSNNETEAITSNNQNENRAGDEKVGIQSNTNTNWQDTEQSLNTNEESEQNRFTTKSEGTISKMKVKPDNITPEKEKKEEELPPRPPSPKQYKECNLIPPKPPSRSQTRHQVSAFKICTSSTEDEAKKKALLTPPTPPPRSSSSSSSSRCSSLCTAKYNPTTSSATDIASLIADEDHLHSYQPLTLREICLKRLLELPFGTEVLQELAEVSKSCSEYISSTYISNKFGDVTNTVSSDIPVQKMEGLERLGRSLNNFTRERTIPVVNDQGQSSVRWAGSSQSFCNTNPDDLVRSLKEVDILRVTEDLESEHIPKERVIPICTDWRRSMPHLDQSSGVNEPVFKKLLNDMKKTEIHIPIHKEWDDRQRIKSERNIPIIRNCSKSVNNLDEFVIPLVESSQEKESYIRKEEIRVSKGSNFSTDRTEYHTPVRKSWSEENEGVTKRSKEVNIPISKNLSESDTIYSRSFPTDTNTAKNAGKGSKEVTIPIMLENNEHGTKNVLETSEKVVDNKHVRNSTVTNTKEVIIPIVQKSTEENKQVKKSVKFNNVLLPNQANSTSTTSNKVLESNLSQDTLSSNKQKEVNVPITKDWVIPSPYKGQPIDHQKIHTVSGSTLKTKEVTIPITKEWVGLPSEKDPKHLLCLSPKQKEELEKCRKIPQEADKLMELHQKYYNRVTSDELKKTPTEQDVTITSIESVTTPLTTNRLLTIIKEEPSTTNPENLECLYFERRSSNTLPKSTNQSESARLNARNLNEWLNLARNKSMSESNLSSAAFGAIPENNLRSMFAPAAPAAPLRRTSLPSERIDRQMIQLQEKEREIQRQLEELEEERRKLNVEMAPSRQFHPEDYNISKKGDYAESKKRPTSMPAMPTEMFRQQMYEEYMDKVAEKEERKRQKVIKVSSASENEKTEKTKEVVHPIQIEDEFMDKVKQKQQAGKLEKMKSLDKESSVEKEKDDDDATLVLNGQKVENRKKLPKHLQEFVDITKQSTKAEPDDGVWSPGQKFDPKDSPFEFQQSPKSQQDDSGIPPVWTPKSANSSPTVERKEFKPVNFQSPTLGRKNRTKSECLDQSSSPSSDPPWKGGPDYNSDTDLLPPKQDQQRRLPTSHSYPSSGFNEFTSTGSRLPKAQNPTITLLQKAREGHLPKGPNYIEVETKPYRPPRNDRPPIANPGEVLYQIKHEYTSDSDADSRPRKMADLGPRKFEGIGPVSKDGMPLILRSEVKDQNQSKWYKRMYDTIHKQRPRNDEYVTVRYKQRRAQYPYSSGYLSEPEPGAYDSDFTDYKYQTLDRRKPITQTMDYSTSTMPRSTTVRSTSSADILRNTHEPYKNQPGRIENYTPGHSSISEKEAKEWWDEVMDIFDGHLEQQKRVPTRQPQGYMSQALKEGGYESDSTLVFRRREEAQQLSPKEQREAYKTIQKGGDVPLYGLRKPAPEKPREPEVPPPPPPPKGIYARNLITESPRKYVENEVTIHYRTPVRQELKGGGYLSEDELAQRHQDQARRILDEERRKKYLQVSKSLQELRDMNSRRHTDNFIPSQKSPISLNRYDDFDDLAPPAKPRPKSPEPRLVAKALYNFVGQTARELTFRKGDLIYVRRQVDKNWYEGELNAMVGLFPVNYVEIVPYDGAKTTLRKPHEGQARAKFNFLAQTHLELSLAKGELVVITRRVDENWFEGKIGGRKGIFPASYVEVLIDPQPMSTFTIPSKPVAAPAAHSLLLNGSAGGKESMGAHLYAPTMAPGYRRSQEQLRDGQREVRRAPLEQELHVETQGEPIPYRALYKYTPQNDDELELLEGDTVYVLEKCDDGWYVGSSERTGAFGTFPGNYVDKI